MSKVTFKLVLSRSRTGKTAAVLTRMAEGEPSYELGVQVEKIEEAVMAALRKSHVANGGKLDYARGSKAELMVAHSRRD